MSANEAQDYHAEQIDVFADTEADLVSAFTLNYVERGDRRGARRESRQHAGGDLVHGRDRRQAADRADAEGRDRRDRSRRPDARRPTTCSTARTRRISPMRSPRTSRGCRRLRGLRANASTRSHAELDAAPDLDAGDPVDARPAVSRPAPAACRSSPCSAAAAAPTTAMSSRSASPARRRSARRLNARCRDAASRRRRNGRPRRRPPAWRFRCARCRRPIVSPRAHRSHPATDRGAWRRSAGSRLDGLAVAEHRDPIGTRLKISSSRCEM